MMATVFIIDYQFFFATGDIFPKLGNITWTFPSFSWGIFSHMTQLNKNVSKPKFLMDYKQVQ